MNKRILDFDFQLSRLFGEFIYDYDNIESANGLYTTINVFRSQANGQNKLERLFIWAQIPHKSEQYANLLR